MNVNTGEDATNLLLYMLIPISVFLAGAYFTKMYYGQNTKQVKFFIVLIFGFISFGLHDDA